MNPLPANYPSMPGGANSPAQARIFAVYAALSEWLAEERETGDVQAVAYRRQLNELRAATLQPPTVPNPHRPPHGGDRKEALCPRS